MNIEEIRKPEYSVDTLFYTRWSPRAYEPIEMPESELNSLFEAAKWAPSCFNEQPWFFLYAKRDTENWKLFFSLLVEMNQSWAKNASVLMVLVSKKTFSKNGKPNDSHSIDAGAAWQSLALQAHSKGWAAHGMAGFDKEAAAKELNIPDDYEVEMMIAVGKQSDKEDLPDSLKEKESPSTRKKVAEITREGKFA
jgi:nitroreductase